MKSLKVLKSVDFRFFEPLKKSEENRKKL